MNVLFDLKIVTNLENLSPFVQVHVTKVYLTLCCVMAASAIGVGLGLLGNIGGILTVVGFVGSLVWFCSIPYWKELKKRISLLMAAALFNGASISRLVDPSAVFSTFVAATLAFGCFSAASLLSRRRKYLYLGGLLGCGVSILIWLFVASAIFGGSTAPFQLQLYLGLMLFAGYIVFDTQTIIVQAYYGDEDYVKHALNLFTDFFVLIIGISTILVKKISDKGDKKQKSNSNERASLTSSSDSSE